MDEGEYQAAKSLLRNNKKANPMHMDGKVTPLYPEKPRMVHPRLDVLIIGGLHSSSSREGG